MTAGPWLLVIDTATNVVVVAAARPDGDLIASRSFEAGHRHGSHLLPTIDGLTEAEGLALADLAGIVVGTGPGAFTGLRVGLATAKTLAHALGVPIVGISTADALLGGATGAGCDLVLLPAGMRELVEVRRGQAASLVSLPLEASEADGAIAVDLEGRAPAGALARGRRAVGELAATLARLGAAELGAGGRSDPETLVPEYVTLPRGAGAPPDDGGVAWSRDPR